MRIIAALTVSFFALELTTRAETVDVRNKSHVAVRVWAMEEGASKYLAPSAWIYAGERRRVYVGAEFPVYLVVVDRYGTQDHVGWIKRDQSDARQPFIEFVHKPVFETKTKEYLVWDRRTRTWRTETRAISVCKTVGGVDRVGGISVLGSTSQYGNGVFEPSRPAPIPAK